MTNRTPAQQLAENWNRVVDEVRQATEDAGRPVGDTVVIGVTKYVDAQVTGWLVDAGCQNLGENRPQLLWQKADELALDDSVRWHVIGHLQRNKVRRTLRYRPLIHSIDSPRLLKSVADESANLSLESHVMLEVNISGEDAKTGMTPDQIRSVIGDLPSAGIKVVGIMAMAGWGTDSKAAQAQFASARQFRDQLAAEFDLSLPHLSMGMSGDFVEAIAEGATMVRIGSRLYEGVVDIG
ncbi:Pyridoxal phosphate homeostasis protein [Rubripirellula lacrimiformis]|uniref:Pyridoxal phosphate homeostasis protein n=1 Tax=Rubripirellula lacrimiformis TaxID=1930273 RepID=A0A517NBB6_9BACT|nr:YggS family pyridoxal phosphate-dependent enzyme [Rubripirellula lacrimiformis]QDT04425.1 Pyridoxal phosphate homeostasis protein [Rubripirellula lacrimiformis]